MDRTFLTLCRLLLAGVALNLVIPRETRAQEPAETSGLALFEQRLDAMKAALDKIPGYSVEVKNSWQTQGSGKAREGQRTYFIEVAPEGKFRLDIQSTNQARSRLLAVSDGKNVTTALVDQSLYSQAPAQAHRGELRQNRLLSISLIGSGLDWLLRPDVTEFAESQASGVELVGEVPSGETSLSHFRMRWGHDRQLEVWISAAPEARVRKLVQTTMIPLQHDKSFQIVSTSEWVWTTKEAPPSDFQIELPEGSRRVEDLYAELAGTTPDELVGLPLPDVDLVRPNGKQTRLLVPEGSRGMMLTFWATWCVPSIDELPQFTELIRQQKEAGIAAWSICVGEDAGELRRFLDKHKTESEMFVDPQGRVAEAFNVTALPEIIIVGADGKIVAALRGRGLEFQARVRAELEKLPAK